MTRNIKIFTAVAAIGLFMSCKKEDTLTIPPTVATFAGKSSASYYVQDDPASAYTVTIGSTTAGSTDRKINFSVSSPTGAVEGAQYEIGTSSVTIPAGKTVADFDVRGLFAGYAQGQIDTLIIKLTSGDIPIAEFNNTFTLVIQKFCPVVLDDFLGDYANCFDTQSGSPDYGPYFSTFSSVTPTGPTSGTVVIDNFWDVGTSITAELDWSDPANFKTNIPEQYLYDDANYGPATIKPVGTGTFSSCDGTFSFSYTVTVAAGSFGNFITTYER